MGPLLPGLPRHEAVLRGGPAWEVAALGPAARRQALHDRRPRDGGGPEDLRDAPEAAVDRGAAGDWHQGLARVPRARRLHGARRGAAGHEGYLTSVAFME